MVRYLGISTDNRYVNCSVDTTKTPDRNGVQETLSLLKGHAPQLRQEKRQLEGEGVEGITHRRS